MERGVRQKKMRQLEQEKELGDVNRHTWEFIQILKPLEGIRLYPCLPFRLQFHIFSKSIFLGFYQQWNQLLCLSKIFFTRESILELPLCFLNQSHIFPQLLLQFLCHFCEWNNDNDIGCLFSI